MGATNKQINAIKIAERRIFRDKTNEKERLRKLKEVENRIKRYEPELVALKGKLDRLYQRRDKLNEGHNEK